MNNEATLVKIQKIKLYGMLKAFNQSLEAEAFVKKRGDRIRVSFMGHRYEDILQPIFSKINHKLEEKGIKPVYHWLDDDKTEFEFK